MKYLRALLAAFFVILLALPGGAMADDLRPKPTPRDSGRAALPPSKINRCAEFGPGFVMVEGSSTCVKLGGAISVGGGARMSR